MRDEGWGKKRKPSECRPFAPKHPEGSLIPHPSSLIPHPYFFAFSNNPKYCPYPSSANFATGMKRMDAEFMQ